MNAQTTFTTPAELAAQTGWSERQIKRLAREFGCCRIVGNRMVLTAEDVEDFLRFTKPEPTRSKPGAPPAVGGDYEDLVKMRAKTGVTAQEALRAMLDKSRDDRRREKLKK